MIPKIVPTLTLLIFAELFFYTLLKAKKKPKRRSPRIILNDARIHTNNWSGGGEGGGDGGSGGFDGGFGGDGDGDGSCDGGDGGGGDC